MSENADKKELKLNTLYAFKKGMTSYVTQKGVLEAVTILKFEPIIVSDIKSNEKHGYEALQVAFCPNKAKHTSKARAQSLKKTGFENGARFVREIRQPLPEGVEVGQKVSIESFAPGDEIKITATSKGKGFEGVVKRWNMAGGPQTHGSGFHRRPGSSGNRTWPGRVMPGKKFPGQLGNETVTLRSTVVEVVPEENVIVMRGSLPGANNSLVRLTKV